MNRDIYELIKKIINKKVKGADTYINNGSRWLIFTDEKKWIFELTKEGTLWYNFYFFQRIFKLISLDVVDNQHHITKWVENFIQNGMKHTWNPNNRVMAGVDGVKDTFLVQGTRNGIVEDTIQNGVKETKHNTFEDGLAMEEAIQNGVKQTHLGGKDRKIDEIENIIENGVKETWGYEYQPQIRINEVINKGEKSIWNNDTTKL